MIISVRSAVSIVVANDLTEVIDAIDNRKDCTLYINGREDAVAQQEAVNCPVWKSGRADNLAETVDPGGYCIECIRHIDKSERAVIQEKAALGPAGDVVADDLALGIVPEGYGVVGTGHIDGRRDHGRQSR